MKTLISKLNPQSDIRPFAFLLSILLSLLWISYQQPVNVDGVLYLHTASVYVNQGWREAFHTFNWPFYPILIGVVSKITHLNLLSAAYLLNTLCIGIVMVAFISIVKNLGANKSVQLIAAGVILFYPPLAHERTALVRDFGYYAWMLLSLNSLISFAATRKIIYALFWSVTVILAGMFRIEGFVFLLLVPFVCFFLKELNFRNKLQSFLALSLLPLLFLSAITFVLLHHQVGSNFTSTYGLISADFTHVLNNIHAIFSHHIDVLRKYLLNEFAQNNAALILLGGIIAIFVANFIVAMNVINLFLGIYGFKHHVAKLGANNKIILSVYIIINCIILFGFLSQELFITIRYIMLLVMILLLIVPFSIYHLIINRQPLIYRALLFVALSLLVISSIFHIGISKTYIIHAGKWVQTHTPPQANFYFNSTPLMYYSERAGIQFSKNYDNTDVPLIFKDETWHAFNYFVLAINHDNLEAIQKQLAELQLITIKTFFSSRGDAVLVVQNTRQHNT